MIEKKGLSNILIKKHLKNSKTLWTNFVGPMHSLRANLVTCVTLAQSCVCLLKPTEFSGPAVLKYVNACKT